MANRVPSGPEGIPILGSSLQYADDPLGFMEHVAREYGDVARIDVYGTEVYQVTDPAAIRRVLVTNAANYRKPNLGGDEGLGGLLGDGLLTSDGDHWQRQRKAMQPSFYGAKLDEYGDIIVRDTVELADSLVDGEHTDIHAEMSELTLRIVVESLLGARIDGMERAIREALLEVGERFQPGPQGFVPEEVPTPRNVRYRRAVEKLDRILREIRRQHDYSGDESDLLGVLLDREEAGDLDAESVRNEMMTMLLAGHDTTALTLTYAWYLLSKHPEVAARFHDELDSVVDGTPTVTDLADLDYLDKIVAEAMRLYPPAYVIYRQRRRRRTNSRGSTSRRIPSSPRHSGSSTTTSVSSPTRGSSDPNAGRTSSAANSRRSPTSRSAAARASVSATGSPCARRNSCWRPSERASRSTSCRQRRCRSSRSSPCTRRIRSK